MIFIHVSISLAVIKPRSNGTDLIFDASLRTHFPYHQLSLTIMRVVKPDFGGIEICPGLNSSAEFTKTSKIRKSKKNSQLYLQTGSTRPAKFTKMARIANFC